MTALLLTAAAVCALAAVAVAYALIGACRAGRAAASECDAQEPR